MQVSGHCIQVDTILPDMAKQVGNKDCFRHGFYKTML